MYNKPGWCQLFSYATYVTSFLSVWFVVSFSFERYLTIQFPLKRHVLCRPRRARLVVLSVTALALLIYNFVLWTSVSVRLYGEEIVAGETAGRSRMSCCVSSGTFNLNLADRSGRPSFSRFLAPTDNQLTSARCARQHTHARTQRGASLRGVAGRGWAAVAVNQGKLRAVPKPCSIRILILILILY